MQALQLGGWPVRCPGRLPERLPSRRTGLCHAGLLMLQHLLPLIQHLLLPLKLQLLLLLMMLRRRRCRRRRRRGD